MDGREVTLGRWGQLLAPAWARGAYLKIETGTPSNLAAHSGNAYRLWVRKPLAAADDDDDDQPFSNWLSTDQLGRYLNRFLVESWLPEGSEPDWRVELHPWGPGDAAPNSGESRSTSA